MPACLMTVDGPGEPAAQPARKVTSLDEHRDVASSVSRVSADLEPMQHRPIAQSTTQTADRLRVNPPVQTGEVT
jgi:hypothetical protein